MFSVVNQGWDKYIVFHSDCTTDTLLNYGPNVQTKVLACWLLFDLKSNIDGRGQVSWSMMFRKLSDL